MHKRGVALQLGKFLFMNVWEPDGFNVLCVTHFYIARLNREWLYLLFWFFCYAVAKAKSASIYLLSRESLWGEGWLLVGSLESPLFSEAHSVKESLDIRWILSTRWCGWADAWDTNNWSCMESPKTHFCTSVFDIWWKCYLPYELGDQKEKLFLMIAKMFRIYLKHISVEESFCLSSSLGFLHEESMFCIKEKLTKMTTKVWVT